MNNSHYSYTDQDHLVWQRLIEQQKHLVIKVACSEYIEGLEKINFPSMYIPNSHDISERLKDLSGWSLIPVDKIVSNGIFFEMLCKKQFPVIRKIRHADEIDFYTDESPDVFHEYFGHCPLLTYQPYADSMQCFGKYAKNCSEELLFILSKLFWATFEFGLIKNQDEIKIYGAGILPSRTETLRIFENQNFRVERLNIFSELESSLQGNINQEVYYYIESLNDLFDIIKYDLDALVKSYSQKHGIC